MGNRRDATTTGISAVRGIAIIGEDIKTGPITNIGPWTVEKHRRHTSYAEVDDSIIIDDARREGNADYRKHSRKTANTLSAKDRSE